MSLIPISKSVDRAPFGHDAFAQVEDDFMPAVAEARYRAFLLSGEHLPTAVTDKARGGAQ